MRAAVARISLAGVLVVGYLEQRGNPILLPLELLLLELLLLELLLLELLLPRTTPRSRQRLPKRP